MAALAFSATRRRNVSTKSSILKVQTRDVDCSALDYPPEDGEFVTQAGESPVTSGEDTIVYHWTADNLEADTVAATDVQASSLCMVWGSALHTDRQATGHTCVPVLMHGGIEVECKLFNGDTAEDLSTTYALGKLVSVAKAASTVQGTDERLVLEPMEEGEVGWAVGIVRDRSTDADPVAGHGDSVTVYLYDKPVKIGLVTAGA